MAPQQFASFYSIACELLLRDQEDSFRTAAQSFSEFKELLFAHSVQDPPCRSEAHLTPAVFPSKLHRL